MNSRFFVLKTLIFYSHLCLHCVTLLPVSFSTGVLVSFGHTNLMYGPVHVPLALTSISLFFLRLFLNVSLFLPLPFTLDL